LVKEYSPINKFDPDELLPTDRITMKWNCSVCDMGWEASIRERVNRDKECPYCSGKKAIPGKTSFKALYPELDKEYSLINKYDPDTLVPTYTIDMKWNCSICDIGWEASISDRVNGVKECSYCSGTKAIPGKTSFKALYPELMNDWKNI
jgi:DNA-directed RNA polymerase subunit RPC12/RpoP